MDIDNLLEQSKLLQSATSPEIFEKLWQGSMPGMINGMYNDREVYYSSYLSSYIERDVRELSGSIDALKFKNFVSAMAVRSAQMLNYSALHFIQRITKLSNISILV